MFETIIPPAATAGQNPIANNGSASPSTTAQNPSASNPSSASNQPAGENGDPAASQGDGGASLDDGTYSTTPTNEEVEQSPASPNNTAPTQEQNASPSDNTPEVTDQTDGDENDVEPAPLDNAGNTNNDAVPHDGADQASASEADNSSGEAEITTPVAVSPSPSQAKSVYSRPVSSGYSAASSNVTLKNDAVTERGLRALSDAAFTTLRNRAIAAQKDQIIRSVLDAIEKGTFEGTALKAFRETDTENESESNLIVRYYAEA